ncbi:type IV secretory system conjugative DNA transfer family protein [Maliponia aquimaris]|uniref:Conjugal transfer protein TraG n=1 Tax=Maliponia aquimaris TaxID=1673631 RepID=A0A238JTA8_9RHOB|nr:type IV secretory system conjugative DNA transfer family protein [Maliponia aquimaris]SMX33417.1 Conjugal transfer protein TraG [Maliponia aquimaris]
MTLLLGWTDPLETPQPVGFGRRAPEDARRRPYRDPNKEGHWLCVAPTGTGKSASFAIPQLLTYPGSMIVVDVKGELANTTARYRRTLGEVLILDPFEQVGGSEGAFNPLSHLSADDPGLVDDAYTLASLFGYGPAQSHSSQNDRFWDESGQDVIAALIVQAVRDKDPAERTLGAVYEKFHGEDPNYKLAVMLDNGNPHPFTLDKIGGYLELPDVTRGGVRATVNQQLRMLAGQGVRKSFASNSMDPDILSAGTPCTLYLVLPPDRLGSHSGLIRIALTALLQRLLRRLHRPAHPTLLLVDEAAQLGPIPALSAAITLGRGFGIRAALLVQSLAQLRHAYGTAHDTIIENCSLITMGRHTAFSMARQLAEQGFGDVSAETLFGLTRDEVMIRASGEPSRRLRKLDYRHDALFAGRFDPNPLYEPLRAPTTQLKLAL